MSIVLKQRAILTERVSHTIVVFLSSFVNVLHFTEEKSLIMKGCVFVTFRKNSSFPLETETDTLFTFLYDKFRTTIKSTDLR